MSPRAWIRDHWPRLRLRTILFATLFLVAALPGVGAVALRVYENALVRQTEAELVAQSAALAATAETLWPPAPPGRPVGPATVPVAVDLSETPILGERPDPTPAPPPTPDAEIAAVGLGPILARTRAATLASIILLDRDGRIVAGTTQRGSNAALPEVAAALAGQPQTALRRNAAYRQVYAFEWLTRAAAIRVHHARPIVVDGRVVGVLLLSRSARALFRGLYEDRGKIALGIAVIFMALVVLSGLLSRGIARPIEALSAATRAVASGRGHVPDPPQTAAIEIQALYADFAAMAAAIERRSRYLRDFAYAVSHEFKTPLAGIRGAIELLDEHGDTMAPAERHRFLANADADAARLSRLVTRLLELARADMATAGASRADVAAVAHAVAAATRAPDFAVSVEIADPPCAAIPADMLDTVLGSLIDNSRQAGATRVTIAAMHTDDAIALTIADNGPGIAPGDRSRIFDPFFTTRREAGGTGLGLSIVRSLLEASGATIALGDAEQGTVIVVTLPHG